jgi:hypothetical protein
MCHIPNSATLATVDHPLGIFSGDPAACVVDDSEGWEETLNPMMKSTFGWGSGAGELYLNGIVWRGQHGLDGFKNFIAYFVEEHGLAGGLIESKIEVLLSAIDHKCVISYQNIDYHDHRLIMLKVPVLGES